MSDDRFRCLLCVSLCVRFGGYRNGFSYCFLHVAHSLLLLCGSLSRASLEDRLATALAASSTLPPPYGSEGQGRRMSDDHFCSFFCIGALHPFPRISNDRPSPASPPSRVRPDYRSEDQDWAMSHRRVPDDHFCCFVCHRVTPFAHSP